MRFGVVLYNLGKISLVLAVSMLLPEIYSVIYGEGDLFALFTAQLIMLAVGGGLMFGCRKKRKLTLRYREGFAIATFGWLLAATLGAIPYVLGDCCPPVDAWLESMSGFTTTGASILPDLEALPRGILIWRGLTHWLGGIGIVVLLLALVSGSSGSKMYKAEAPGNSLIDKLAPKTGDTAKILLLVYLTMSVLCLLLLMLAGMNFVDALCHTFGSVSTGGFSSHNASMSVYDDNPAAQWIVIFFMVAAGANFAYYYLSIVRRRNYFIRSEEFRVYILIIIGATVAMVASLIHNGIYPDKSLEYIIRQAMFQVVTIMTTTGFYSADYELWPPFCRVLLFCLFFIGGCAGSTAGSMKVSRIIIGVKTCAAACGKALQPKLVTAVKLDKKALSSGMISQVMVFIVLYLFLLLLGALVLGWQGLTPFESFSVTMASLGNVGPAFETYGPTYNYIGLTNFSKIFLAFYMMIGRLELMTVLVLFTRGFWRK